MRLKDLTREVNWAMRSFDAGRDFGDEHVPRGTSSGATLESETFTDSVTQGMGMTPEMGRVTKQARCPDVKCLVGEVTFTVPADVRASPMGLCPWCHAMLVRR